MNKLESSSMLGLIAVPPTPNPWLGNCQGPPDELHVRRHVCLLDQKEWSLRFLLAVAFSAVTSIGLTAIIISVCRIFSRPATPHPTTTEAE
jgi:hypothetical protein